jgi:preprotein translocase subunit YajC
MELLSLGILCATRSSAEGQASPLGFLLPMAAVFAIFYFLVFRPARKKQLQTAEMREKLKAGDRIVTTGGIHGTVVGITDDVVQIRIADKVKIDVSKSAVAGMLRSDG